APTRKCIEELFIRSAFEPIMQEHWVETGHVTEDVNGQIVPGRICAIAKAKPMDSLHRIQRLKLMGVQ
ncbi:MAG: hypothetical protein AAGA69_04865, partial [Pseudomonadota bacterium]